LGSHVFEQPLALKAATLAVIFHLFAFFLEPTVKLLKLFFKLNLTLMQVLEKFLQLSVFDLIGTGKFGDLLSHEGNISLILICKTLFF